MRTISGQILRPRENGICELQRGVVSIRDEIVSSVEFSPKDSPASDDEPLICPGFIDSHLHLPQFDSIGATGLELLPWLEEVIFPAEARWNDLEFAQSMIQRVIGQLAANGTTGVCAYSTVSQAATLAALHAFDELGMRGVIGQSLMDVGAPSELLCPCDKLVDELVSTLDRYPPGSRMATAVTPRFVLSCTPELLAAAGKLAAERNAVIQTHLSENVEECKAVERSFGNYVDAYARFGLVTERSIFGHGIHLSESDRKNLAASKSIIAHCPTANEFLASGTMSRFAHMNAGVKLSLGSDIGAGYERSMVRVGRAMILAAMKISQTAPNETAPGEFERSVVPSAPQAWFQITRGNAQTLGWKDAGEIVEGRPADLVVVRPAFPWRTTRCPLSTLMFAWDDRWVQETLVLGRTVYRAGSTT